MRDTRDGTAPGGGRTARRARRQVGAPRHARPLAAALVAIAAVTAVACAGRPGPGDGPTPRASADARADGAASADTSGEGATRRRAPRHPLDDTVAVGYGTQRRRDVTGAVGSVVFEDAADQQGPRLEQLLARVPGVQVMPRGDGSYRVRVRGMQFGDGDPLWVLDGMPVHAGVLSTIVPRDVERIDVLKDASAAIYGAQARHGVILVRTRHGP